MLLCCKNGCAKCSDVAHVVALNAAVKFVHWLTFVCCENSHILRNDKSSFLYSERHRFKIYRNVSRDVYMKILDTNITALDAIATMDVSDFHT